MKLVKELSNLQLNERFTASRSLHSSPMQRTVRRRIGRSDQDNKPAAHSLGIPGFKTPSGFEVFHRVLVAAGSRP
jgi:hypothetical protein